LWGSSEDVLIYDNGIDVARQEMPLPDVTGLRP